MDLFLSFATLGPLVIYFAFLALIHLRRRPTILSGQTDTFLLALALSGFFMVGMGPAVIPISSLVNYGSFSWLLLFFLYILSAFLVASTLSRKIVIYNLESARVKEILLAGGFSLTGDVLFLPALGITAHMTPFARMRNTTLSLLGTAPKPKDWLEFRKEMTKTFSSVPTTRSRTAILLFVILALLTGIIMIG